MSKFSFNAFDRVLTIERVNGAWSSFQMGTEGKRRAVELAIPSEIEHGELAQYLYDVFHEDATPTNGDIFETFPK